MGQQTAGTSAASVRQVDTSKIREKGRHSMPCIRAVSIEGNTIATGTVHLITGHYLAYYTRGWMMMSVEQSVE
jgi:hypothetical protein